MAAETPSGLTSGQITIPANQAVQLGSMVQMNVDKNCALGAFQVTMQADGSNSGPILFGQDTTVSASKYGYSLAAGGNRQVGGGTGNLVPWGRWWVFSTSSTVLHIEILP